MTEPTLPAQLPTPIDCETAIRRLWDYIDGRLPAAERGEVEIHLATCERCPPHFAFAVELRSALASMRSRELADSEERELREKVHRALNRHL